MQGDWNAKVGPEAYESWSGTVGRFGLGETKDCGMRFLEFARSHQLTLANTPQQAVQNCNMALTKWADPQPNLAPQHFKSSINKARTRTFPVADIGSDHDLVMMTFSLKLNSK